MSRQPDNPITNASPGATSTHQSTSPKTVGAGFPLGSVCILLLLGKIYESFNLKWALVATTLLFEVGSAICGPAPTMNTLIDGRVVAGAGGPGICLGSLALQTTEKERVFYMALIGVAWGAGAVTGSVIGGAFAVSTATWRWPFYINWFVAAVAAPGFLTCLPAIYPVQGVGIRGRLVRTKWVGFLLGAGVGVTFLMASTMAGGEWAWGSGRTIAGFVVFGMLLIAYALQQYYSLHPHHRARRRRRAGHEHGLHRRRPHPPARRRRRRAQPAERRADRGGGGGSSRSRWRGQIYQSTGLRNLNAALAGHGFAREETGGAVVGAQSALFERLGGPLRERAVAAITDAMKMTMVVVPVSEAVMILAVVCMKQERLFEKGSLSALNETLFGNNQVQHREIL